METTNETIAAEEYKEAVEILKSHIIEAINRSISHDEKVEVAIDASAVDMNDAFCLIAWIADEYDSNRENDGSEDVWGEFNGDCFRLNLYLA